MALGSLRTTILMDSTSIGSLWISQAQLDFKLRVILALCSLYHLIKVLHAPKAAEDFADSVAQQIRNGVSDPYSIAYSCKTKNGGLQCFPLVGMWSEQIFHSFRWPLFYLCALSWTLLLAAKPGIALYWLSLLPPRYVCLYMFMYILPFLLNEKFGFLLLLHS